MLYAMAALARRLGVPFRSGGSLCASKIPDAQAAFESANTLLPTCLAGVNFVLHTAGWLEGGLAMGYEKFVMDVDQAGMMHTLLAGSGHVPERPGARCDPRSRPRQAFPRLRAHAGEFRERVLPLAARRQQQLRAVGGRGRHRYDQARERAVEEAARRIRRTADGPGRRRGAARLHGAAQGGVRRIRTSEGAGRPLGWGGAARRGRRPRVSVCTRRFLRRRQIDHFAQLAYSRPSCAEWPSPRRNAAESAARSPSPSSRSAARAPR